MAFTTGWFARSRVPRATPRTASPTRAEKLSAASTISVGSNLFFATPGSSSLILQRFHIGRLSLPPWRLPPLAQARLPFLQIAAIANGRFDLLIRVVPRRNVVELPFP